MGKWRECPKCQNHRDDNHAKAMKDWRDSYGSIELDDFIASKPKEERVADINETLRVDFEAWVDSDLVFHMRYSCNCDKCGLQFETEMTEVTEQAELNEKGSSDEA